MLRYSKLTDAQILAKLLEVCEKEKVEYTEDGMEAVIFTSQVSILQTLPLQPIKPLLNWLTESRQLSISISMWTVIIFRATWDKHWTTSSRLKKVSVWSKQKMSSKFVTSPTPSWSKTCSRIATREVSTTPTRSCFRYKAEAILSTTTETAEVTFFRRH